MSIAILPDGTEILHERRTQTTRWIVARSSKSKSLLLGIDQGPQRVVCVNLTNVVRFLSQLPDELLAELQIKLEANRIPPDDPAPKESNDQPPSHE